MIGHVGLQLNLLGQTISPMVNSVNRQSQFYDKFSTYGEISTRQPEDALPVRKPKFPHKPPANQPPRAPNHGRKQRGPPVTPRVISIPAVDLPGPGP